MKADSVKYEFLLDNQFFMDLDEPEVQKGKLAVTLEVRKAVDIFLLDFRTEGYIIVPCDRCLDEMELPILSTDHLKVRTGIALAEEDDMVVVPEEDGYINVAWFMYEFIVLNIPIKHVHAPGKCNKDMMSKLKEHLRTEMDEGDDDEEMLMLSETKESDEDSHKTDPRWNELKKILDNN